MFIKENINPTGKKKSDCVIRAIAKAENRAWLDVFDELTMLARKWYTVPNVKECYDKYLSAKYPTIPIMHKVSGKNKRYTVNELAKEYSRNTVIISIAGHLAVAVNGNYYDIWDCGDSCSYKAWVIR
ncbi:hypothetical protein D3C81_11050 [compost metagenome]